LVARIKLFIPPSSSFSLFLSITYHKNHTTTTSKRNKKEEEEELLQITKYHVPPAPPLILFFPLAQYLQYVFEKELYS
jgi:hypothetical protein